MIKLVLCSALAVLALGCDCGGPGGGPCESNADCNEGMVCRDGTCVAMTDGGGRDAALPDGALPDGGGCADGQSACGTSCCAASEICRFDACVSDLGPCATSDECWGDSYCVDGRCV